MELKWYAPARWLGLVKDISHEYNDGFTHYTVSVKANDVFACLTLSLLPVLFLAGFLIRFLCTRRGKADKGKTAVRVIAVILLIYAILLAVGVGPYIQLYPQSSGFLDFSTLEHIVDGVYCALLALSVYMGGRLGNKLGK